MEIAEWNGGGAFFLKRRMFTVLATVTLMVLLSLPGLANETPRITNLLLDLHYTEPHLMLGVDRIVVGFMQRDAALGYPRSAWGVSPFLGLTWRTYHGQPRAREIERAAEFVTRRYVDVSEDAWRRRVKREVADYTFSYIGISTLLVFPGLDVGLSWDFADHKGSGANLAMGVTWGLNTLLVPRPYVAASYSF